MTETLTLTDFLLARIAEDEDDAEETRRHLDAMEAAACSERPTVVHVMGMTFPHPARVLAECGAKRRIASRCDMILRGRSEGMFDDGRAVDSEDALRALALPYADHPDYREEWKP